MRLNKQGVRDLNPAGYNGRAKAARCAHFYGPTVVVGHRWASDGWDEWQEEIIGQRCMHCSDVKEIR